MSLSAVLSPKSEKRIEEPIWLAGRVAAEIVTEGSGWYEQLADRAELNVEFRGSGRDRAAAVAELGKNVAAAEPALTLAALTLTHRRLAVHDEWRGTKVVGCRATEHVGLRVDDVTALEDVLNALVAAEPAGLDGPRWQLSDPAAARLAAQEQAVADARDRAEGYAIALDATLGPLRRLSEAGDPGAAPVAFRMARAEAAPPDVRELGLEPEPVRVTVRCTTTWELLT
jgi:uncharacterized protein YggE